jgi:hypothetical protein
LCATNGTNRAWNAGGVGYFHVGNGWRSHNDALYVRDVRGTDDTDNAGYLSADHDCQFDRAGLAIRDTSYLVHDRFSGLDGTGGVVPASRGCVCRDRNVRTDAVDGTANGLHIHDGQHSHDDAIDRDDARDCAGDHPHTIRRQHNRHRVANITVGEPIERRMQLYAGGASDQWRRFAALDPGSSKQSGAWYDSARGLGDCRHQHRSGNGRDADTEYVGLRREHDDESDDAPRHDGPG